jgi:hypothetical protein
MSCIFSPCRRYRYTLERIWSPGDWVNFLMLNPSTADDKQNDPTVTRCINFAKRWGFGGLIVTNIFAFRATDPKRLYGLANPVGVDNDLHILGAADVCKFTVCAWGAHGTLLRRDEKVLELLKSKRPYCLGRTDKGHPRHPLYIPANVVLRPMFEGSDATRIQTGVS